MKFVTYRHGGRITWGAVTEDGGGVIDLGRRLPDLPDLSSALESDRLDEARDAASWAEADCALSEVVFERTIPRPGKIICIGVNYGGRNAEYADSSSSSNPSVFVRFPASLTGHGQPLQHADKQAGQRQAAPFGIGGYMEQHDLPLAQGLAGDQRRAVFQCGDGARGEAGIGLGDHLRRDGDLCRDGETKEG